MVVNNIYERKSEGRLPIRKIQNLYNDKNIFLILIFAKKNLREQILYRDIYVPLNRYKKIDQVINLD